MGRQGFTALLLAAMILGTQSTFAGEIAPLPRRRLPAIDAKSVPSQPVSATPGDHRQPLTVPLADDAPCLARLRNLGTHFERPVTTNRTNSACVIEVAVRLKSITARAPAPTNIRLSEEPIVSCEFAERFSNFLAMVAPLVKGRTSADLTSVHTGPGYECRNRNGLPAGKLSAHAQGRALDISSFELSTGASVPVRPNSDDTTQEVVGAVRTAACGWFTTVLGPGSDSYHTDHMHVDLLMHGSSDRYRICE